jgi:hypothetical protein
MENQLILKKQRIIPILASLFILLIIIVAVISSVWPKQEKFFMELGILGENMTADAYFSNDDSIVEVGTESKWYIYVHNHMATSQNVSIRVKLLNSTMQLPDDREHNPSSAKILTELSQSLSVDETVFIPFFWSIIEVENQNDSIVIKSLEINAESIEAEIIETINSYYIMVFELWIYDPEKADYVFNWKTSEQSYSSSIYMNFLINL